MRDRNGDDPIVRRGGDPDEAPDERIVAQALARRTPAPRAKQSSAPTTAGARMQQRGDGERALLEHAFGATAVW